MQIGISRLPLWLSGIAGAFLLYLAGRGVYFYTVLHREGMEFLYGTGIPTVVIAVFVLMATLPAWRLRNVVMLEFGDEELNFLGPDKQRRNIPYRAIREAGIAKIRGPRRVWIALRIVTEDNVKYEVQLNSLAAGPDAIFEELKRRLRGFKPSQEREQWLVRK